MWKASDASTPPARPSQARDAAELLDVLDACSTARTWKTRGRPAEPDSRWRPRPRPATERVRLLGPENPETQAFANALEQWRDNTAQ